MEHPQIRADYLKRLTEIALPISVVNYSREYSTSRAYYAELFFGKITLNAQSICDLFPTSDEDQKTIDASSIATLARSLMESYDNLHYICIEKTSKEERNFRMDLMGLHHTVEVRKIMTNFGFDEDNMTRAMFEKMERITTIHLERNPYFQSLDQNTKNKLIRGERAYFNKTGSLSKFPIDSAMKSAIYKFLSNSVHSTGLSLMNYYEGPNRSPLGVLGVLFIAVETSFLYLAASIKAYTKLRWKVSKMVSQEDKSFVNNLLDNSRLQNWIEFRKWLDTQQNYLKLIK